MANANFKQLEKMRLEKLRSLNDDEIKEYIAVILTELMKLQDIDTVSALENPFVLDDDFNDLNSKLDEIDGILSERYNFNDILKTMKYNYEMSAHIGTKIKYSANRFKLRLAVINSLFIAILDDYKLLQDMLDSYYHLIIYLLELDNTVSSDKPAADVVSAIDTVKINVIDSYKYGIGDLSENLNKLISIADDLFKSNESLDDDIAEMKETILSINDSSDEKDVLSKRTGVLDAVVTLYDSYVDMKEFKETYDNIVSGVKSYTESENAFLLYSKVRYYDAADDGDIDISLDEFMKSEPKFNIKKSELILP